MQEEKDQIRGAAQRGEIQTLQELTSIGVDVTGIVDDGVSCTTQCIMCRLSEYMVIIMFGSRTTPDIHDLIDENPT